MSPRLILKCLELAEFIDWREVRLELQEKVKEKVKRNMDVIKTLGIILVGGCLFAIGHQNSKILKLLEDSPKYSWVTNVALLDPDDIFKRAENLGFITHENADAIYHRHQRETTNAERGEPFYVNGTGDYVPSSTFTGDFLKRNFGTSNVVFYSNTVYQPGMGVGLPGQPPVPIRNALIERTYHDCTNCITIEWINPIVGKWCKENLKKYGDYKDWPDPKVIEFSLNKCYEGDRFLAWLKSEPWIQGSTR